MTNNGYGIIAGRSCFSQIIRMIFQHRTNGKLKLPPPGVMAALFGIAFILQLSTARAAGLHAHASHAAGESAGRHPPARPDHGAWRGPESVDLLSFDFSDRQMLPTGPWGCPGPIRIHPLAQVPTLVYWRQAIYDNPQPTDGLKWAVYLGWPDGPWRIYDIPVVDPLGQPVTRLERPRISFTYDPDGYPAVAIGLDDGGIRYLENSESSDPVYIGSILLLRPDRENAGQWTSEFVPFGLADVNYAARLDYPHLAFSANGDPIISAVGYHAVQDDVAADKPYEEMLLARKSGGQWRVQKVLFSICPCFCFDCPGANSPGRDIGSTEQPPCLVLGNSSPESIADAFAVCPFSLNPFLRYITPYPSLSFRSNAPSSADDDTVRLAFGFGERVSATSTQLRNFVYTVDFGVSPDAMAAEGPLPVFKKKKMQSKNTLDFWDDFIYSGQSTTGAYVASYGDSPSALYNDEYQLRKNVGNSWNLQSMSRVPLLQNYDRQDFRFWLPETVQQIPAGSHFGFLTPFATFVTPIVIQEWDIKNLATSLSYFGSNLAGCSGSYYCSQVVVNNSGGELAYDPSLTFGAFPAQGLQGKAYVCFHAVSDSGSYIIISPQDEPLAASAGYGDFDFDMILNACSDTCAINAAFSGPAWSINPLCDGDGDGDVDLTDLDLYGPALNCCE